jgi:hypothetical protein
MVTQNHALLEQPAQNENAAENEQIIERVAITPEEFAAKFGRSVTWAYRRIYEGKVKVIPGMRPMLIPVAEVGRFLKRARVYNGAR